MKQLYHFRYVIMLKGFIPRSSLNLSATSFSSVVSMVSSNFANTGSGKNHNMRDVNPFAFLDWSWMTGIAAYGCVIPKRENDVQDMVKFTFPVTVNKTNRLV